MNDQLTLDLRPRASRKNLTIHQRFMAFHEANPHVFELIERMAQRKIAEGRTRLGVGYLCEQLRDDVSTVTNDAHSRFKVNNDYRALYADLLVEKHPKWDSIIERRVRKSA